MNKKVEDLVDFLFDKGMSQKSYLKLADWQELHSSYDMLNYCTKIYDLFNYIGLTNDQIERFLINNKRILLMPFNEIVKIAYVLHKVNVNDEIFSTDFYSSRSTNYKRIFIRNILFEKGNRYAGGYGVFALLTEDKKAYEECLEKVARDVFNKNIYTDNDLENYLNNCILFNNEHVTVDEYIDKASKLFYMEYIRKTKKDRRK